MSNLCMSNLCPFRTTTTDDHTKTIKIEEKKKQLIVFIVYMSGAEI